MTNETMCKAQQDSKLAIAIATILIVTLLFVGGIQWLLVQRLEVAPSRVLEESQAIRADVRSLGGYVSALAVARADSEVTLDVLSDAGAAVVGIDTYGRISIWSRGAEEMMGYSRAETIGQSLNFILPDEMVSGHYRAYQDAVKADSEEPVHAIVECSVRRKDNPHIDVDIAIWVLPGKRGVAIITKKAPSETLPR